MASNLATQFQVLWKRRGLERSCRWTVEQLGSHQRTQLAQTLRFAREHSSFYGRFHRGMDNKPLE
jgi:phenylacetate-CoA ligase